MKTPLDYVLEILTELYNACKLMDMDGEEYVFHPLDEGLESVKIRKTFYPKTFTH